MTDFNPFSDEGQLWLEENKVEDQYDSLENLGMSRTRTHSSHRLINRYNTEGIKTLQTKIDKTESLKSKDE